MAQHSVELEGTPEIIDVAMHLTHTNGVLRLRKVNAQGVWDPSAPYVGAGNLVLDVWSPKALKALSGFIAYADVDGGDALLFRLSPDGGTTQLWWDGGGWVVALDPVLSWNTEIEVDAHIAVFPFNAGVTQIVRFVSATGRTTPMLKATVIFYEVAYDAVVDFTDSLARTIAAGLTIRGDFLAQGLVAVPTVTIDDPIWTVNNPVLVFNVTNDPNMRTNLAVSRVGNVVTLVSPQTGDLRVHYVGTLDLSRIHIATDPDFEKAELPALVIQTPTVTKIRYEKTNKGLEELLRSQNTVRLRNSPTFQSVTTLVQCNAAWDLHARKLRDAVWRFLENLDVLRSRALDENLSRSAIGPENYTNDLVQQVVTFSTPVTFRAIDWPEQLLDTPMVVGATLNTWPTPVVPSQGPTSDSSGISIFEPDASSSPAPLDRSFVEIPFSYGSSNPLDFGDLQVGDTIIDADVVVEIAFDDPTATIALGLVSAPGSILGATATDPTSVGTYNNGSDQQILAVDQLRLQIVSGTSTQGSGRVIVTVVRL